jgi:methionyl-tRNA synthetase
VATLSFDGETHSELLAKVKRWVASVEGEVEERSVAEAVSATAELAKDALRIVASAAPGPVAENDVIKGLTALGYQAADASSKAIVDALDAVSALTGGSVVKRAQSRAKNTVWEMNTQVAKQVLKNLTR